MATGSTRRRQTSLSISFVNILVQLVTLQLTQCAYLAISQMSTQFSTTLLVWHSVQLVLPTQLLAIAQSVTAFVAHALEAPLSAIHAVMGTCSTKAGV